MRYFTADPLLRGGAAFTSMALSSVEITPADVAQREISKAMGFPNGCTLNAIQQGEEDLGSFWLRCSDDLWSSVEPHLTAAEALTVTTTEPAGWSEDVTYPFYTGFNKAQNIMCVSDSIAYLDGVGGSGVGSYVHQAVTSLTGSLRSPYLGRTSREFYNNLFGLVHMGVGGTFLEHETYLSSHSKMYDQCYGTMSLNNANMTIFLSLGSNDLSGGDSAGTVWARMVDLMVKFNTDFPLAKILVATVIRRTEDSGLNAKIAALNTLIRANAPNVFDAEAAHADFSATSGDSTTGNYNADNTHLSGDGIALQATALATKLSSALVDGYGTGYTGRPTGAITAQYFRFKFYTGYSDVWTGVQEAKVFDTDDVDVTSLATLSSPASFYASTVGSLVDGDLTTSGGLMNMSDGTGSHHVDMDFGVPITFKELRLHDRGDAGDAYAESHTSRGCGIYYSDNGTDWTLLCVGYFVPSPTSEWHTIQAPHVTGLTEIGPHLWAGVYCADTNDTNKIGNFTIQEAAFYSGETLKIGDGASPESSLESSQVAGLDADKMLDSGGGSGNRWNSQVADSPSAQLFAYEMAVAASIDRVDLTASDYSTYYNTMVKDFALVASNDGLTFVPLKEVSGETSWTSGETRSYEV